MIATAVAQDQVQLRLLKVFAEMCTFTDVLENAAQRIENVYQVLRVRILSILLEAGGNNYILYYFLGIYALAKIGRGRCKQSSAFVPILTC